MASSTTGDSLTPTALTAGFQDAFLVGAGLAIAGLDAAAFMISGRESRAPRQGEIAVVPAGA